MRICVYLPCTLLLMLGLGGSRSFCVYLLRIERVCVFPCQFTTCCVCISHRLVLICHGLNSCACQHVPHNLTPPQITVDGTTSFVHLTPEFTPISMRSTR
jgi:hypothetical protein